MDRDEMISEFRQRLKARSEDYCLEVFNMPKRHVVDPDAVWNLANLRERTKARGSEGSPNEIDLIHAEIWVRSLALTAGLQSLEFEGIYLISDPQSGVVNGWNEGVLLEMNWVHELGSRVSTIVIFFHKM